MPIDIQTIDDDYILYTILCDYCDKEYTIRYRMEETLKQPRQAIECCPFCSNYIEEPAERIHDEETSWD
jgi:hypothetical protein